MVEAGSFNIKKITLSLTHETAEVRDVRRIIGGRHGLCRGAEKMVDGVLSRRPQRFPHQRRSVNDCSPGRRGMAPNGGARRGGTFHGEMDCCRESQGGSGLRHAVACPNVTARTKERIAQSKRARAGSLAIVD